MKNRLISVGLVLFLSLASLSTRAQTDDIAVLKKLNAAWIGSYPSKDTATLSRIFADDLVLTNPVGVTMTKSTILKNVASGNQRILSTKVDSVDVRLLGSNVGLVTATASFTLESNGKAITGRTCYLDVYEKRNGQWVAVAAHLTSLP